jgi:adenosylcobinamide kinase / adenosylcobinamide-phosphate guanylyltransferase
VRVREATVPDGVTFLLGGARSGKSTLALQIGHEWPGPVTFVATARLDGRDDDLARRVARHRAERPAHWSTVETPSAIIAAVSAATADSLVIVDCLTLWVADAFDDPERERRIEADAVLLAGACSARHAPTILVSNEVGLGVHPTTELARRYRDTLGRVNATIAGRADRTLLLVGGRATPLVDPWSLLT